MNRLTLSSNRRFLVFNDGSPFFWLADTAWELFHRLTIEDAEFYLENRRRKGFTVIQAVVLAELDGLNTPNPYGERPLVDNNPLQPNERYFAYVDRVIQLAGDRGLFVGLLPTWGDKVELLAHGKGPIIFNPDNARRYGEWIGRRYRDFENIVWINGGDRSGGGANTPIWNALGSAIKHVDPNHLMTFHPLGGGGGHSSSEWFHREDWLDFNLAQSGHECRGLPNHEIIARDYALEPAKPCLDGEPRYEDHAVNWKPAELGYFDDHDARQAAYWAVFSGACGHTYGCHPIWQFLDDKREPVGFARRPWREALDLPGATQMGYLRGLLESRPPLTRVPDQSLLVDSKTGAEHIRASRGRDYAFVYLPQGGSVELNPRTLSKLGGNLSGNETSTLAAQPSGEPCTSLKASWFDPRHGTMLDSGTFKVANTWCFTAPTCGRGQDWVLILDPPDLQRG